VGNFNIPLSPIDRLSRQKINRKISELNDTMNQMDLTNIYRVFHPAAVQYTFFSAAHGTFSKIDNILGHKASLNKHMKIEINVLCFIRPQNGVKLEIISKRSYKKYSDT
jgi:hypothetical protein